MSDSRKFSQDNKYRTNSRKETADEMRRFENYDFNQDSTFQQNDINGKYESNSVYQSI